MQSLTGFPDPLRICNYKEMSWEGGDPSLLPAVPSSQPTSLGSCRLPAFPLLGLHVLISCPQGHGGRVLGAALSAPTGEGWRDRTARGMAPEGEEAEETPVLPESHHPESAGRGHGRAGCSRTQAPAWPSAPCLPLGPPSLQPQSPRLWAVTAKASCSAEITPAPYFILIPRLSLALVSSRLGSSSLARSPD